MADHYDLILDNDNDLLIKDGDFVVGESTMQEVGIILGLNQGDLKPFPLLGPNLIQLKKTNVSRFDIEQRIRVHLSQDDKSYDEIKNKINLKNTTND